MSGSSHTLDKSLTVGDLKKLLDGVDDAWVVEVPSMHRCPGSFIGADHVFVDPRDKTVSIDGDIAEAAQKGAVSV